LDAFTPHPFPTLSKAALLTGGDAALAGVRGAFDPLPGSTRTWAHVLREAGYSVAHVGKWQLGVRDPSAPLVGEAHARSSVDPLHRGGFDFWWGWDGGFLINDPWVHGTGENGFRRVLGYQSDVVAERVIGLIRTLPEPWFICAHVDPPHPPYDAPVPDGSPEIDFRMLPSDMPADPELRQSVRREVRASVRHLAATQRAFERVLDASEAASGRTLTALFANHGDQHGSGGLLRKGWPHAASLRVPLALKLTGEVPVGIPVKGLFSLAELGATCARLARAGVPGEVLSGDRTDALRGEKEFPHEAVASIPAPLGLPLQCPYAWRARLTRERIDWSEIGGDRRGTSPWLHAGWCGDQAPATS
jgi:hypothetical protein